MNRREFSRGFSAGNPASAGPALAEHLRQMLASSVEGALQATEAARAKWRG